MNWISINKLKPETEVYASTRIKSNEFYNEYIECLVHTNFGYMVARRIHDIQTKTIEVEPNVIEREKVDYGWYWDVEVGNSIKENPIFIDFWCVITPTPSKEFL